MKNLFSKKSIGILCACVLGALSSHTAYAQGQPGFSNNQLVGNQTGTGYDFFYVTSGNGADAASHLKIAGPNSSERGSMVYNAGWSPNKPTNFSHSFFLRPSNNNDYVMGLGIRQNGQVQIGSRVPSSQPNYKLAVDGQLVSTSVFVTNPSTWADFVFEPSYKPMELSELESYLQKNKHLPHIPSAKEVEANGYNVTEMDAKLLQTVEELTLQVIALSKQVEDLRTVKAATSQEVK